MGQLTQQGVLLVETYGARLLSYLCAVGTEQMLQRFRGGTRLNQGQEATLQNLTATALQLVAQREATRVPIVYGLQFLGKYDEPSGTSFLNALRIRSGGDILRQLPDDPVGAPLTRLLRDVFPLTLAPLEPEPFPRPPLAAALWGNPARDLFQDAVLDDHDLAKLFPDRSDRSPKGTVHRSTGAASDLSLGVFPELLLTKAWQYGRSSGADGVEDLAHRLVELLDILRRAARGETCTIRVLVAMSGTLLDGVDVVPLPFGTLRPLTQYERELAPRSLEGGVGGSSPSGESVTVAYAGDVVLETDMEYRLEIRPWPADLDADRPDSLRSYEALEVNLETIRLAAVLCGDKQNPPPLVPTWRAVFDPLDWLLVNGWRDPRTGPSFMPRRMDADTAADFAAWVARVHTRPRPSMDVAARRMISAMAERKDSADALVDLVIVWENLFGSRQGEPTLRVSAALGWLLGSSAEEREAISSRAARLYSLRSDIVHGNREIGSREAGQALAEARSLTVDALRALFEQRPEVLMLRDGDARSRHLMMGR